MQNRGNTISAANIAIVKGIYNRFEVGYIDGLLELVTKDTTWDHRGVSAPDSPKNKVFHGREGVAEFFKTIEDTQDVLDHDVINFIASGDKVVSIGFWVKGLFRRQRRCPSLSTVEESKY